MLIYVINKFVNKIEMQCGLLLLLPAHNRSSSQPLSLPHSDSLSLSLSLHCLTVNALCKPLSASTFLPFFSLFFLTFQCYFVYLHATFPLTQTLVACRIWIWVHFAISLMNNICCIHFHTHIQSHSHANVCSYVIIAYYKFLLPVTRRRGKYHIAKATGCELVGN